MKKTLVGLCNNVAYHEEKISLWTRSFRKHSDGDVFLVMANASDDDKFACDRIGINFESCSIEDTYYINHKRLEHISSWLKRSDSDVILSTDVFDVFFQGDPFQKLDLDKYDLFVSGEGVKVSHCPWNHTNINELFPNHISSCASNEIINSGVICGKRLGMINLYEKMIDLCENVSTNNHNIKDQAALIVLVSNNQIPKLKIFNLEDAWAVHCAVAGPTQFFTSWGFKDKILERYGIPFVSDNTVLSSSGNRYDIVHQFNRIPEWHKFIVESLL